VKKSSGSSAANRGGKSITNWVVPGAAKRNVKKSAGKKKSSNANAFAAMMMDSDSDSD